MRKADNLPPYCAVVKKSRGLNFLDPSWPAWPVTGVLYLYFIVRWVRVTLFVGLVACAVKTRAALEYRWRFGEFAKFRCGKRLIYCPQTLYCSLHLLSYSDNLPEHQGLEFTLTGFVWYTVSCPRTAISTYRLRLMNFLQSKNCSLHLLSYSDNLPAHQGLEFTLTDFVWYTVSCPRTAVSTYRLRLMNFLQSKNYSLHFTAVFGVPVPVQVLQFSPNSSVWYTVSSPRTALNSSV